MINSRDSKILRLVVVEEVPGQQMTHTTAIDRNTLDLNIPVGVVCFVSQGLSSLDATLYHIIHLLSTQKGEMNISSQTKNGSIADLFFVPLKRQS